jgi:hypothetical protein
MRKALVFQGPEFTGLVGAGKLLDRMRCLLIVSLDLGVNLFFIGRDGRQYCVTTTVPSAFWTLTKSGSAAALW